MLVKITPNFSFACSRPRSEGDRRYGSTISVCEQRNAAMVVRVLGNERRQVFLVTVILLGFEILPEIYRR